MIKGLVIIIGIFVLSYMAGLKYSIIIPIIAFIIGYLMGRK